MKNNPSMFSVGTVAFCAALGILTFGLREHRKAETRRELERQKQERVVELARHLDMKRFDPNKSAYDRLQDEIEAKQAKAARR